MLDQLKSRTAMRPLDEVIAESVVPADHWPRAARIIRSLRSEEDAGLGDTIERELGRVGSAIKWAMSALTINCGCADRRDWLNARYPY